MTRLLSAAAVLVAAISFSGPASAACRAGYHKVTIQGNSVCAINTGGNNALAAPSVPTNAQKKAATNVKRVP